MLQLPSSSFLGVLYNTLLFSRTCVHDSNFIVTIRCDVKFVVMPISNRPTIFSNMAGYERFQTKLRVL